MNEHLRDRVLRKLETLSDERGYQLLDYVEFLESKYAERPAPSATSIFARFSEAVEDRLRAGKVSASAIAETMGLMNRAMNVLNGVATGVAAAGRSVASDLATATATRAPGQPPTAGPASTSGTAANPATSSSGAPVAGSAAASGAPSPSSPADSAGQGLDGEPRATESGELEPPLGR